MGDVVGVHMGCKAPDACWRNKSYNFGRRKTIALATETDIILPEPDFTKPNTTGTWTFCFPVKKMTIRMDHIEKTCKIRGFLSALSDNYRIQNKTSFGQKK